MRDLGTLRLAGFLVLLLNSGYLYAFPAPNLFYAVNVLLHIGLGVVIVAAWVLKFKHPSGTEIGRAHV